jgi:hypothetical protein
MQNYYKQIVCYVFLVLPLFIAKGAIAQSFNNLSLFPNQNTRYIDSLGTDSFTLDLEEIIKLGKIVYTNIKLAQTIKAEYSTLFKIRGYHPMAGYSYQGIGTLNFGISRGTRSIFRPLLYQNIHANALLFINTSPLEQYGLNIGYTQSKALYFWGFESMGIRNKVGNITYAVRPEIGFSILGVLNIGYGYNFIINQNYTDISSHTFVVRYTFQSPKKAIKKKVREINYIFNRDYQKLKKIGLDTKSI